MRPGFSKPGAPCPAPTPCTFATERQRSCHSSCGRFGCFAVNAPAVGRGNSSPASVRELPSTAHNKGEHHEHKKHTIYVINTSESGKSYWNRAGVAFLNRDGSFTFKLDILPQTKFQLREEKPATKSRPPNSGRRAATRAPCPGCRSHAQKSRRKRCAVCGLRVKRAIVLRRRPDDRGATSA